MNRTVSGVINNLPGHASTQFVTIDEPGTSRTVTLEVETGMIKRITGS